MPVLSPRPSRLDRDEFVAAFGGIYEHSAWVAEATAASGIGGTDDTPAGLAERMAAVVDDAGPDAQRALLRAHPELAGKLAVAGSLTAESAAEQTSAGLDRCTPDEFAAFKSLNEAYNARFGFPFIVAVRGLTRLEILAAFRARVDNDPETEFRTALDQVHKIARLRLGAMACQSCS